MNTRGWGALTVVAMLAMVVACGQDTSGMVTEDSPPSETPEGEQITIPRRAAAPDEKLDAGTAPDVEPPLLGMDGGGDAGPKARLVFVTSSSSSAKYGGLSGADARCADHATKAGLTGTWVAWLSNGSGPHAVDRLMGDGPWALVSGELVATSKADLKTQLKHAIDHDEKGIAVPPSRVWTGTGADGRYSTNDCDHWSNGGNEGRHGETTFVDARWTTSGVDSCDDQRRLYCFQQ